MTYDQLVTLDSIIKNGSFKAASEMLHKSQPALSVSIKKLEEEFQIKIFDREQYRPKLTEHGKAFYEKAKHALVHMKSLELFGEELGLGVESEIKIGLDGVASLNTVLCELRLFFSEYNSTNLKLDIDYISGTREKLLSGEIDIGFAPLHNQNEFFDYEKCFEVKMIPVYSPEYITTSKNDTNFFRSLPQILVKDSGSPKDEFHGVLEGARKWYVTDMSSKKSIIQSGLGWGRLPEFMIADELKSAKLKIVEIQEFEISNISIYKIKNKNKALGPVSRKLWERFKYE